MHVLTFFLVLGIGADDIFVFVDGWKQTVGHGKDLTEQARLYWTYFRTAHAVFNTSFTTVMAFIATGISPIMPISTFGYYAAICIVMNYVFVLVYTPPIVIIWSRYFEGKPCCPPPCCVTDDSSAAEAAVAGGAGEAAPVEVGLRIMAVEEKANSEGSSPQPGSGTGVGAGCESSHESGILEDDASSKIDAGSSGDDDASSNPPNKPYNGNGHEGRDDQPTEESASASASESELKVEDMPLLQRFFAVYYLPVMRTKVQGFRVVAICFVVVLIAWSLLAFYSAAQLEPPEEPEEWFKPEHMWYKVGPWLADR